MPIWFACFAPQSFSRMGALFAIPRFVSDRYEVDLIPRQVFVYSAHRSLSRLQALSAVPSVPCRCGFDLITARVFALVDHALAAYLQWVCASSCVHHQRACIFWSLSPTHVPDSFGRVNRDR